MSTQTTQLTPATPTTLAPSTHNQNNRFSAFQGTVQQIQQDVSQTAVHMESYDQHLYLVLSQTLDLGLDLVSERLRDKKGRDTLKEFVESNEKKWNNKSDVNSFYGLVDVAFDFVDPLSGKVFSSAPTRSKYRLVLRFAY